VFYLFVSRATNAKSKGLITEVTGKNRGSTPWKRPFSRLIGSCGAADAEIGGEHYPKYAFWCLLLLNSSTAAGEANEFS
jgi:hypothetical protein